MESRVRKKGGENMGNRRKSINIDLMNREMTIQGAERMGYAKIVTSSKPTDFNPPCLLQVTETTGKDEQDSGSESEV